ATEVWFTPLHHDEALGRTLHLAEQLPVQPEPNAQQLKSELGLAQFVGESPAMLRAIRQIPDLAQSKVNVLILGETGTGKEICARSIHQLGPRASQPFVALNSAALPPELFENELFGHGAGAFTGANGAMLGSIARANAGTLFFDEIGSLGLPVQAKLL